MAFANTLKTAVRRLTNSLGYDIVGYDGHNSRWRLARLLAQQGITAILDVGANIGHFGWDMRELGYRGKIISFEPLRDAFLQLKENARNDPAWQAVNCGLGAQDEERLIHVAGNSQSSSFLPMLETHRDAAPESVYQKQELAAICRLDRVFADYCGPADAVFLKIDTQGFERQVLEGARATLPDIALAQLECSLVPLYEGAESIEQTIGLMRDLGYDPVDLQPTFYHRDTRHLMQADVLFVRRQKSPAPPA